MPEKPLNFVREIAGVRHYLMSVLTEQDAYMVIARNMSAGLRLVELHEFQGGHGVCEGAVTAAPLPEVEGKAGLADMEIDDVVLLSILTSAAAKAADGAILAKGLPDE